jgi:hypothetical protein
VTAPLPPQEPQPRGAIEPLARWRGFYGARPLHLLGHLALFALAAYAAYRISLGPLPVRVAVWFVGAAVAHDLVLFPLYALADRSLVAGLRARRSVRPPAAVPVVNYVRVPAGLSLLLLLLFWPLITRHSEDTVRFVSRLGTSPYLGHWLAVTAALFVASAVLYAVRLGRTRRAPGPVG